MIDFVADFHLVSWPQENFDVKFFARKYMKRARPLDYRVFPDLGRTIVAVHDQKLSRTKVYIPGVFICEIVF